MAQAEQERVVEALLERYGRRSLAEQAEIHMKDSRTRCISCSSRPR